MILHDACPVGLSAWDYDYFHFRLNGSLFLLACDRVCVYVCMCCVCMYAFVCVYVCMFVCVCICMCVCVCFIVQVQSHGACVGA